MRIETVARVALAALLASSACDSDEPAPRDRVFYQLGGAMRGARLIESDPNAESEPVSEPATETDAWGGARIGCTVVNEADHDLTRGQVFVLSAVENYGEEHGVGIYLKVKAFHGTGRYALEQTGGRAWVFDRGHVQACARADDRTCYQGAEGCEVEITHWDFGADVRPASGAPSTVSFGAASGRFSCRSLQNGATGGAVSVFGGTFNCRAQDWTRSRAR